MKPLKLKIVQKLPEPIQQDWTVEQIVNEHTPQGWRKVFENSRDELLGVSEIIKREEEKYGPFYPLKKDLFKAFELTPLSKVRVVILGQDPYHQCNPKTGYPRAQGLSFSVSKEDIIPVSLQNIYKELSNSVSNFTIPEHGDLTKWTSQGVLLLNSSLTVRPNQPNSHKYLWTGFIHQVIQAISEKRPNVIYLLWGKEAQDFTRYIDNEAHQLTATHPSGYSASRGFFGCNHFNKVNEILLQLGETPVDWQV